MKAKRKMGVLLLVEVRLQDDAEFIHDAEHGGLALYSETRGMKSAYGPAVVAREVDEELRDLFPRSRYADQLWYVKSVKEATAP